MQLTLTRKMKAGLSVLGTMSYGEKSWLTLENAAYIIPLGEYPLSYTWSTKFKRLLPLITVPHRKGIRIHAGNTSQDTKGCILLGNFVYNGSGEFYLGESRKAMADFLSLPFIPVLKSAGNETLLIQNDPNFSLNYFDEWNV